MPKANKHIEVKPSKYKTSLCQYFAKNVECPYGERCVFAHGEHELQSEEENIALLKNTGLSRLDRGLSSIIDNVNGDLVKVTDKVTIRDESSSKNTQPSFTLSDSDNDLSGSDSNQSSLSSHAEQVGQEHHCLQKPQLEHQYLEQQTNINERQVSHPSVCINNMLSSKLSGKLLRRRPVMVSLPKFDTTCETGTSPYESNVDTLLTRKLSKLTATTISTSDSKSSNRSNIADSVARTVGSVTKESLPSRSCSNSIDVFVEGNDVLKADTENKIEKQVCTKGKHVRHGVCRSSWQATQCACAFSATCARDRPTVYRHNPYLICEAMQQQEQEQQQQKMYK